ncbi:MAG: exopolyphosphatase [Flavobacteriales bacterium]|nr:exopolyphosphatase [Flavobacteriales bacterium]
MNRKKYGAIDIGSNAVRLLLANVYEMNNETAYKKVSLVRVPIRLGEDVFKDKAISKGKAKDFESTMIAFEHLMKVHKVDQYRACATSAMRDSENGSALVAKVKKRTGIEIEIISGDEEAEMIRSTHIQDRLDKNNDFLYVDVGGGSTEISFYEDGDLAASRSFNIGTIRLLQNMVTEEAWHEMKDWLETTIKGFKGLDIIGSGGNITKIYKVLGKRDWEPIKYAELSLVLNQMSEMTYEERMFKYKLHPDRADVIIFAGSIFSEVLKWAKSDNIYVPKMGLADGIIKSMHPNLSFR